MANKPIKKIIKLQIEATKATPAPPVGTALGPHGLNIQDFCKQFNDATREMMGSIVPAEITIYEDRSFAFKLKTPPASDMLRKAAGIEKGSAVPNRSKAGKISASDLSQIAEKKLVDLNTDDLESAKKIVAGTARSMGIEIN